jgi:hypothetical protein
MMPHLHLSNEIRCQYDRAPATALEMKEASLYLLDISMAYSAWSRSELVDSRIKRLRIGIRNTHPQLSNYPLVSRNQSDITTCLQEHECFLF